MIAIDIAICPHCGQNMTDDPDRCPECDGALLHPHRLPYRVQQLLIIALIVSVATAFVVGVIKAVIG